MSKVRLLHWNVFEDGLADTPASVGFSDDFSRRFSRLLSIVSDSGDGGGALATFYGFVKTRDFSELPEVTPIDSTSSFFGFIDIVYTLIYHTLGGEAALADEELPLAYKARKAVLEDGGESALGRPVGGTLRSLFLHSSLADPTVPPRDAPPNHWRAESFDDQLSLLERTMTHGKPMERSRGALGRGCLRGDGSRARRQVDRLRRLQWHALDTLTLTLTSHPHLSPSLAFTHSRCRSHPCSHRESTPALTVAARHALQHAGTLSWSSSLGRRVWKRETLVLCKWMGLDAHGHQDTRGLRAPLPRSGPSPTPPAATAAALRRFCRLGRISARIRALIEVELDERSGGLERLRTPTFQAAVRWLLSEMIAHAHANPRLQDAVAEFTGASTAVDRADHEALVSAVFDVVAREIRQWMDARSPAAAAVVSGAGRRVS